MACAGAWGSSNVSSDDCATPATTLTPGGIYANKSSSKPVFAIISPLLSENEVDVFISLPITTSPSASASSRRGWAGAKVINVFANQCGSLFGDLACNLLIDTKMRAQNK